MRHLVVILALFAVLAQGALAQASTVLACAEVTASADGATRGDGCCVSTSRAATPGEPSDRPEVGHPRCACCNVAPPGVAAAATVVSAVDSPARGAILCRAETSHLNVLALPAVPPPRA